MNYAITTGNATLDAWVTETAALCEPETIVVCDGSEGERAELVERMLASGTLVALNPAKRPNSYLCRSDARDVARVESRTFICSREESDAGPTNRWQDPAVMRGHPSS